MPTLSVTDLVLQAIATSNAAANAALPAGSRWHPMPIDLMRRQITSDRFSLAGEHLRAGDQLVFSQQFRSSISRHYYAMYTAARAVVFAHIFGDDHQAHSVLPRHLPMALPDASRREVELTDARLLRNEADYTAYPVAPSDWEDDARQLAATAADFVQACEDFALGNGHV